MRYQQPVVFGKNPTDLTPSRWNFLGQQGWFRVPLGWFARRNQDGTLTASPTNDFSGPKYDVQINNDGYMVFQSMSCAPQYVAPLISGNFPQLPLQVKDGTVLPSVDDSGNIVKWPFRDMATGVTVYLRIVDGQIQISDT